MKLLDSLADNSLIFLFSYKKIFVHRHTSHLACLILASVNK